jgi:hypothetical protein
MWQQTQVPVDGVDLLTAEADLTDWAEQHDTVSLPDDEYPHTGHGAAFIDAGD